MLGLTRSQVCLRALLRRLVDDRRGGILALSVVLLLFVLGTGGLILDFGRVWNSQSELQAFADHAALVAAGELDGAADAITRAEAALDQLISDRQAYATGDLTLDDSDLVVTFLSGLPAADTDNNFSPFVTSDPALAQLVRVVVNPHTVSTIFANVLMAASGNAQVDLNVQAGAVAGYIREVCNFPPLMMCNPYETAGNKEFTPIIGQQVLLKAQGASSDWAPGDFGLLDIVGTAGEGECTGGLSGTNRIRCVMALINPNSQCVGGRVNIRPGQAMSVHAGLNVRFDIWDPPLQGKQTDPDFAPAANVTKGMSHAPNQCQLNQFTPAPDTVPLPRDGCFESGTCEAGRFGDVVTTAQLSDYWSANHGGAALPAELAGGTRYDVYRYEIDHGQIPQSTDPNGEDGAPSCAPAGYDNPLLDRRNLIVAVINCNEHNIHGNTDDVPVIAFAEMFLTEPAGDTPNSELYAEMLGVLEPGGEDGVLHDFPQLYR